MTMENQLLKLFSETKNKIYLKEHEGLILVLGNSGVGKTTFTLFITGKDDDLRSQETEEFSGEFIIEDTLDRISRGAETIVSKTTYPQEFVDVIDGSIYCDFPGYNDTRNTNINIANAYYNKKTINEAKKVKILFLIDYDSVKGGGNRHGLLDLLKSATETIKNVDKFSDSLALVITKVPNRKICQSGTDKLVPDAIMIRGVVRFLNDAKEQICNLIQNSAVTDQTLKLLEIFLQEKNGSHGRIELFRCPDRSGSLQNISLLTESRDRIKKMVNDELKYTLCTENDFGYTISAETQMGIFEIVGDLEKNIFDEIDKLLQMLKEHYLNEEQKITDVFEIKIFFQKHFESFDKVMSEHNSDKDLWKMVKKFIDLAVSFNICDSKSNYSRFESRKNFLEGLQEISTKPLKFGYEECRRKCDHFLQHLRNSNLTYDFLIELNKRLGEYALQINKSACNWDDANCLSLKFDDGLSIQKILLPLWDKLNCHGLESKLERIVFNESSSKLLEDVLNFNLSPFLIAEAPDNVLRIIGNFIVMGDVKKLFTEKINRLELLASCKIFIDEDLEKIGEKLDVIIIAPTWEIIGQRKIVLSGKPGEPHSSSASNAVNSTDFGRDGVKGTHGLPGNTGGLGSNFFGIGLEFINGRKLTVEANGGDGGPGQNGGNGGRGGDGETPEDLTDASDGEEVSRSGLYLGFYNRINTNRNKKSGKAGNGGDGGNGGPGGAGGNPGIIQIIQFGKNSGVKTHNSLGKTGNPGRGGVGGEPGVGRNLEALRTDHYFLFFNVSTQWSGFSRSTCKEKFGKRGSSGLNGCKLPKEGSSLWSNVSSCVSSYLTANDNLSERDSDGETFSKKISSSITDYKLNVRANNITHPIFASFSQHIDNHPDILKLYNLSGLAYEFLEIENKNNLDQMNRNSLSISMYESFLLKLIPHEQFDDEPSRRLYKCLYMATKTKILSLTNNIYDSLIVNIEDYLSNTINNIDELEEIGKKITSIENQFNYRQKLEKRQRETLLAIQNRLEPEANKILGKLNDDVKLMIKQLQERLERAELDLNSQISHEDQKSFMRIMVMKQLGCVLCALISTFTMPAACTSILSIFESIAKTYFAPNNVHNKNHQFAPVTVPRTFTSCLELFYSYFMNHNQQNRNGLCISSGSQAGWLNRISVMVDVIHSSFKKIAPLLKLNEQKRTSKSSGSKKKAKGLSKQLSMLDSLPVIVSVMQNLFENNQSINELTMSQCIDQAKSRINKWEDCLETSCEIIIPATQKLENNIETIMETMREKSRVSLSMTKLEIRKQIQELYYPIKKLMKDFEIDDSVLNCFNELYEVMELSINLYDKIQYYEEQKELAAYISNIDQHSSNVEDSGTEKLVATFQKCVKKNHLIIQYRKIVAALELTMFPFVNSYFNDYDIQVKLCEGKDAETVMMQSINDIRSKLMDHRGTIVPYYDQNLCDKVFSSGITEPFYVWKNQDNKEVIKKFLKGEEVTLRADIRKGCEQDAIKFNCVEIHLKSTNSTEQNLIDRLLKECEIILIHLGDNYYRYKSKYYLIQTQSQEIQHSFMKLPNEEPTTKNNVYKKLKTSHCVLSPYATWKLILCGSSDIKSSLESYGDRIDLELIGSGQFVRENDVVDESTLQKHYIPISVDDIFILNNDVSEEHDSRVVEEIGEDCCASLENAGWLRI